MSVNSELAIITAIYGGYDEPPPIPVGFDDAVLVSDVPIRSEWRNIVHPLPIPHRLASKVPKCRPDLFTSCASSVWLDASGRDPNNWLAGAARKVLSTVDLAAFRHFARSCVYDEAKCCQDWMKYRDWPIRRQMDEYRAAGLPANSGLWACGVLFRNHTHSIKEFGDKWLLENAFKSVHDQLSFPYLLRAMNVFCAELPANMWNVGVAWTPHAKVEQYGILARLARKASSSRSGKYLRAMFDTYSSSK